MTFGILKFDVTDETGPTADGPGIVLENMHYNVSQVNYITKLVCL